MPEDLRDKLLTVSAETQSDTPDGPRPHSTRFFINASGDWRKVVDNGSWWVVGHHLMYPARDRDDAERLRKELSHRTSTSRAGSEARGDGSGH